MAGLQEFTNDDARLLEDVFGRIWFDQKYVELDEFHSYLAIFLYDLFSEDSERDRASRAVDNVHDLLYEWDPGMPFDNLEEESDWIKCARLWISEHIKEHENPYERIPLETMAPEELARKITTSLDAMDESNDDYDPYDQIPDGFGYDDWND